MIAYLANKFPCAVEPYVADEIQELRAHGVTIIACSVKQSRTGLRQNFHSPSGDILCLFPLRFVLIVQSFFFFFHPALRKTISRVMRGHEPLQRRLRALLHTWLGAYFALALKNKGVEHIHVHHGYFASWVGMVAAKLLGIGYSMTLHGSDLLLHAAYLDEKLKNCDSCFTVSQFNRNYILEHFPEVAARKIFVTRMGVAIPLFKIPTPTNLGNLRILSVGRLNSVKNHTFLIRACRILKDRGRSFRCVIAGERRGLEKLIHKLGLEKEVFLVGHVASSKLSDYYTNSDLVVLTSRSEGIPLVLMEAMARGKVVLAPAITGIPELVASGKNGFLYSPGSMRDFVRTVEGFEASLSNMDHIRNNAQKQVQQSFDREKNLAIFAQLFVARLSGTFSSTTEAQDENPVLQQI